MSCITDVIRERRSIRKYAPRPVPTETLREVLEAAQWAPSAHNAQPWRFIVLIDEPSKKELANAMANAWITDMIKEGILPEAREEVTKTSIERFTRAPVLIAACLTMKDMINYEEKSRQNSERDLAVQSLGAAVQNMLLAAHSKKLGACWFCAPVFCKEAVRTILKIPKDVEPQALIAMGYPAEMPPAPHRKTLENYAYAGSWGKNL